MKTAPKSPWRFAVGAAALALLPLPAAAQSGPPNALQGFSKNRNEPIQIEALSLEVRDKDKTATFADNVRVTQGDTVLECKLLIVFYEGGSALGGNTGRRDAPAGAPAGPQQLKRLEAKGGVVVTQKEQTAVGDEGVYDAKTNRLTLIGNVVITHGPNVIRGERLWVDLTTGVSRVESATGGQGRVQAVIVPSSTPAGAAKPEGATPAAGAEGGAPRAQGNGSARDRGRHAPSRPLKLN